MSLGMLLNSLPRATTFGFLHVPIYRNRSLDFTVLRNMRVHPTFASFPGSLGPSGEGPGVVSASKSNPSKKELHYLPQKLIVKASPQNLIFLFVFLSVSWRIPPVEGSLSAQ